MAKKRKLNKRVAILMLAIGAVLGAGVLMLWVQGLPQDPMEAMARGRAAYEAGDYARAAGHYADAVPGLENRGEDVTQALFPLCRTYLDWALKASDLTDTDRRAHYSRGMQLLRRVLYLQVGHEEARRLLCDIYWAAAVSTRTNWKRFIDEADKLLALVPDDHAMLLRRALAKAYLAHTVRGDYPEEALADFREVIRLKPDEPNYWIALAEFLQHPQINETAEAEKVYLEGVEANPDSAELRVRFGNFLRRQHRKQDALEQFKEAIDREPDNTVGLITLAAFYAKEEMLSEAIRKLQAAKKIDESDYRIYRDLAKVYSQRFGAGGDADERRGALDQAARAVREGLDVVNRRLKPNPELQLGDAERRRLTEARWRLNYRLANVLLEHISVGAENEKDLLAQVGECLTKVERLRAPASYRDKIAGRVALAEGRTSEGIALLEKANAVRFDSETASILINLYFKQDLPGKAEKLIMQVMSLPGVNPGPSILVAHIKLLMRFREFDRAERQVKKLLRRDENDQTARNLALSIQVLRGKPPEIPPGLKPSKMTIWLVLDRAAVLWIDDMRDEAVDVVEKLYDVVSRNQPGMVQQKLRVVSRLVSFYMAQGKIDKARVLVDELVRQHPGNLDLVYQQNLLAEPDPKKQLAMRLKIAEALPPLEEALEKANTYAMVGDRDGYLRHMEEAARINPNALGVIEGLFRYYLGKKDWKSAGDIAARAGEANIDRVGGRTYSARLAMAREDYAKAAQMLNEALKRRPELKAAWVMLGKCYVGLDDLGNAYQAFRVVLSSDPSYVPALIEMARVTERLWKMREHAMYVEQAYVTAEGHRNAYIRDRYWVLRGEKAKPDEIGKIIKNREVIFQQDRKNLTNCLHLARLYKRVWQIERAERMYRYIYENTPNRVNGARILVDFLAGTGQAGKAEKIIADLVKTERDKVGVQILYAQLLARYSVEQGKKAFRKAIETDPEDPRGYLEFGRFLTTQAEWAEAARQLRQYNRLRPEDLASEKMLIHAQIEAAQFDPAARRLKRILVAGPSDAEALTLKGLLMMRKRNLGAAEDLLDQAIRENPAYVVPMVYLAQLYLDRDQVAEARDMLQRAGRQTDSPEIKMQLALVQVRMNAYDEAQATLRAILDQHDDYAPAYRLLIRLYMRGKKWHRLERILKDAKKVFPSDEEYPLAEAEMCRRRGDTPGAIIVLAKARAMAPASWPVLGRYLITLVDAKLYDKALAEGRPYLDQSEYAYRLHVGVILARVHAERGQEAKADEMFVAALKEIPAEHLEFAVGQLETAYGVPRTIEKLSGWAALRRKDWQFLMLLGDLYRRSRQYDLAAGALKKALTLVSKARESAVVNRALGAVFHEISQKDARYLAQAQKHYRAAIAAVPGDIKALNNLAYLYTDDLDDPGKGLDLIEGVYKREPNDVRIADTYGWTLAKLGRLKLAEQILERSIQLGEPIPANRYHLGWVYEQTGRAGQALNLYMQALALIGGRTDDRLHRSLSEGVKRVEKKIEPRSGS